MSKEIFITTVTKVEYDSFTEREKSIYDAAFTKGYGTGKKDAGKLTLIILTAVLLGIILSNI